MRIVTLTFLASLLPLFTSAQSGSNGRPFMPIPVTGFNEDVIAEGNGKNALSKTSKEMDALNPSNFVMCTREFGQALGMSRSAGLPNDGKLSAQNKTFVFAPYGNTRSGGNELSPNALYLLQDQKGTLRLNQMINYEKISILGLATEGTVNLTINLLFTDGSSILVRSVFLPDWFDGVSPFFSGFGRIKRENGLTQPIRFEGPPQNPNMYTMDLNLPQNKLLAAIEFQNVTPGDNPASHRAFIFALSGMLPSESIITTTETPVAKPVIIPVETREKKPVVPSVVIPVVSNSFFLHGKVNDGKTKNPLRAKISLMENTTVTTGASSGDYKLMVTAAGEYTVKAEASGYISILQKVKVVSSPSGTELNLSMQPVEIGTTVALKSVLFKVSTANLLEESYDELNMVIDMMKGNPKMTIDLAGHTDNRGDKNLNLKLSTDRVNVVKNYVVEKGIESSRITGKGYGGSKPLFKGTSEADHKLNRRVEFVVTKY